MRIQHNKPTKLLCFVLATLLLCALLAGCGQSPATGKADSGAASSAPAASQQPASEPVSEPESVPAAVPYTVGTRTDTGYTSEWLGIQYTMPSGYVMSTEEEINALMELGADSFYEDKETGKKMLDLSKINIVYEMMASSADGSNVIVMTEKASIPGITSATYILALKQQLASTALSPVIGEQSTIEIAGKQFDTLPITVETNGVSVNQLYCVAQQGDRFACIVASYLEDAQKDTLLASFSPL